MVVGSSKKIVSNEMIVAINKFNILMIVKQTSRYVHVHEWSHRDELKTKEQRPCVTHSNSKEEESKQIQKQHN